MVTTSSILIQFSKSSAVLKAENKVSSKYNKLIAIKTSGQVCYSIPHSSKRLRATFNIKDHAI